VSGGDYTPAGRRAPVAKTRSGSNRRPQADRMTRFELRYQDTGAVIGRYERVGDAE
jgi:hypothetical protein